MAELARVIRGLVFVLGTVAVVTACGGGGSSAPADVEPEPITLELETGTSPELEPGEAVETAPVTISGINRSIAVSVSGGEYSIDGGEYTSADGTISNGQTIQLRAPASSNYEETVTITLTLGEDTVETFQVTTRAKDETPEAFSFTASTSQELGASVNSNAVTITGIDPAVALSVENGSYSLDNGTTFETADTTIDADQTIILQGTASSSYETTETVSLTVGTESANFSITTRAKDITPTAFEFTPATEQEINTSIDSNTVTITGIDPETDISIENGTYSLNGGETFTDAAATINADQEVIVRLTTSGDYESDATATLTVGTESQNFVATTRAKNTTPTAFSITAATDQNLDIDVSSAAFTVTGFDPATAISIENGSYSLDGGSTFTTDANTINPDQEIIIVGRSSTSYETTTQVSLTVGTATEIFSITTRARDITPENLGTFTAVTDGDPSTTYTSNTVTVADIEGAVDISVSAGAAYDINESGVFVSEAGTIESGQTVRVQATTSAEFDTPVVATLTVGTETRNFSVTAVEDSTPAALSLTETVSELDLNEIVTRGPFTVSEINTTVSISIENGEYEIVGSGEGFVTSAGQVEEGDQINVRTTAPNEAAATLLVTLTVGTLSETLTLETVVDNTVPVASIAFPPPISMTEGDTVTVRGTASDEISPVTAVSVNGVDATDTSEDGSFATWQVSIPLAEGSNDITVSVTDGADNTAGSAATVEIVRDSAFGDFPDSNNPLSLPASLALDHNDSRSRLVVGDRDLATLIMVDLSTGVRTVFSNSVGEIVSDFNIYSDGLLVSEDNSLLWMSSPGENALYEIDLDGLSEGGRRILSSRTIPDGTNIFTGPREITFDPLSTDSILAHQGSAILRVSLFDGARTVLSANGQAGLDPVPNADNQFSQPRGAVYYEALNQLFVIDNNREVMTVSMVDGARTYFSDEVTPNSNPPIFDEPKGIGMDLPRNRLLVNDEGLQAIVAVAIEDDETFIAGERSILSDPTTPNTFNSLVTSKEMIYDDRFGYMFVADAGLDAIVAIDIITGERVIISRGVTTP